MIYLDSAALVKLVREEAESGALVDWLNGQPGQRLVASALVEVEVSRELRRSQPGVLGAVAATLATFGSAPLPERWVSAWSHQGSMRADRGPARRRR